MSATLPERPALRIRSTDGGTSFALSGDIDLATAEALRREILPSATRGASVDLDLQDVSFIDSTGLSLFLQILASVGEEGRLRLENTQSFVRRVLHVSGIERHPRLVLD